MAKRIGQGLLVIVVALYAGDWVTFHVRAAHGGGTGSVQVEQFLATPLKGNKMEYDYLGQADVSCARAIFPHASNPPCWWVARHKDHWE